jgi:tRNA threonylcarbamoyladenosine biosynthesis protein TsaB
LVGWRQLPDHPPSFVFPIFDRFPLSDMATLPSLTTTGPVLILDAAASVVQVGLVGADGARWVSAKEEAGVAVFAGVEQLRVDFEAVSALVFCEGPGSILGIRTTAVALRSWQVLRNRPMYAYSSLPLLQAAWRGPTVTFIADARRDSWHVLDATGALRRVATNDLSSPTEFATPDCFRHWSPLPPHTRTVPYQLETLWPAAGHADLLRPAPEPDAFLHEEPNYVTWQPAIHQAVPKRN